MQRLAEQICFDYAGQELVVIVVLKGAFLFAADLVRRIRLPLQVDFIKLKSYQGTMTTGEVLLVKDADIPLAGKHVLVVEDIVDTGISLNFLITTLQSRKPASLKVCAMIDKPERRQSPVSPDYAGIVCRHGFLVGYGLDLDERWRELPAIYELIANPLVEV